jgi:hypothetical protein
MNNLKMNREKTVAMVFWNEGKYWQSRVGCSVKVRDIQW